MNPAALTRSSVPAPVLPASRGFTLVELLVSIAVFVLLIGVVSTLVNSASTVIAGSRKQMDSEGTARVVLDRITSDFASMIKRRDVNCIFSKQRGNDAMFFYAEGSGYFTGSSASRSGVSVIGYRVTKKNTYFDGSPVLERLGKSVAWDRASGADGMVFLASTGTTFATASTLSGNWASLLGTPPKYDNGDGPDFYHVLDAQVFRLEICFLLKSGVYPWSDSAGTDPTDITGYSNDPTTAKTSDATPPYTIDYSQDGNIYGMPPDLAGVLVTIAVLDEASRKLITPEKLDQIAGLLGDSLGGTDMTGQSPINQPVLPAQAWQSTLENPAFSSSAGVPQSVAGQIRIYQRMIRLQ